ncbi:AsmA-like C-terminal region-containing protein [Tundrisphaera sp. TA3]|uniref:AsmA-like C-terminal region-containing protein n=1 Tax=Tundrisphaera sp. TA3 TaxID=3435775 RepID=UPI003EBC7650
MHIPRKLWRWAGVGLILSVAAFFVVRTWVVPAVIVRAIQAQYGGKVVVRSWWLGRDSAGLLGVALLEGPTADSPVWITADRISVDTSLSSMIRGRFMPTRVTVESPKISLRFDAKNQLVTKIPLVPQPDPKPGETPAPLPEIAVVDGSATLTQDGREPLEVRKVAGTMVAKDGREVVKATTDDPTWGRFDIAGEFDQNFQVGEVRLATDPKLVVDKDKIVRLPFVPTEIWENVEPSGPVDARVKIAYKLKDPTPIHLHTEIDLKGVTAKLPTMGVTATGSTGKIVVDDDQVTVQNVEGRTLGGSIGAGGRLVFGPGTPKFDLDMTLNQIDITQAPKSWQLEKVGADGQLSGDVALKVALAKSGPDLTGTVGQAVIEGGSFQGIPIKSLSVSMRAEGQNLQYDTALTAAAAPKMRPDGTPADPNDPLLPENALWSSLEEAVPLLTVWNGGKTVSGWIASEMRKQPPPPPGKPGKGGITLPKTISTEVELEDVDLNMILDKARAYGIKIPVPIAGKFTLKANATIPIATPGDLRKYKFHGESSLKAASINHIDIGRIDAKLDLIDGVLELSDFRGQFVDHPIGDDAHPPAATDLPPKEGALAAGGFRGGVRAQIAPRGRLSARFEALDLPIGELSAPFFPVPNPLSGLFSMGVEASADVARLGDPAAWLVAANADSRRITYQGAVLDRIATRVRLEAGKLDVPEFTASLAGHPLQASGQLSVAAPYQYSGRIDVKEWELAQILAFVPTVPKPAPVAGVIDAQGEAGGSLSPFAIQTRGSARVLRARTEDSPLGNLVLQWTTDRDVIAITGLEAQTFGGRITAEARIPTRPGTNLDASASFKGIDTARLASAFLGDELKLTGIAEGRVKLAMPMDASSIEANVQVNAPDLTVQGVPAESAQITVKGHQDRIDFAVTADSLGGKIRFNGSAPIGVERSKAVVNAELQAAGFQMLGLWRGLGLTGEITRIDGLAALVLNLRATVKPFACWARGAFELRDVHLESPRVPIGGLRGNITQTPTAWQLDDLAGDVFGGTASGRARGEFRPKQPPTAEFDVKVDHASIGRMLLAAPSMMHLVEGTGSVRVNGRLDGMLQATTAVTVPNAKVSNLPLTNLRFPGEVSWNPATGNGSFTCRQWTSKIAGGTLRGSVMLRLGNDRSFQTETQATDFDIELLSRLESDSNKAASGKLTGKVVVTGHDLSQPATYRGRVDLNLADASLVEVPVFREIIRLASVGGAGGGLFDVGEMHGAIMNQTLNISEFMLEGKVIQVHGTGTVTFAGNLNLEVLVNTNRLIPESGQNLIGIIPGLGEAIGRGQDAVLKVASFLSNRLLKFRVTGTVKNPSVALDAGVAVGDSAVGFFSSVLRLPVGGRSR